MRDIDKYIKSFINGNYQRTKNKWKLLATPYGNPLGCSNNYFKNFILLKMELYNDEIIDEDDRMTIDNIEIDHIKPVCKFNFNNFNDYYKCIHYTNYQPLLIKENSKKCGIWNAEDEDFWEHYIIFKDKDNYWLDIFKPELIFWREVMERTEDAEIREVMKRTHKEIMEQ
jgi:hypothetical protein